MRLFPFLQNHTMIGSLTCRTGDLMKYFVTEIHDQVLVELAKSKKASGVTGLWLAGLLRKAGIKCATSGVYRSLERMIEQGLVAKPKSMSLFDKMDRLAEAVGDGDDDLSRSANLPIVGYHLTEKGQMAANLVLIRRSKDQPGKVQKLALAAERQLVGCA